MFGGMGSKVHLVHHLDEAELYRLYREEKDGTQRSHLQIIWLLTWGRSAKFVSEVTGYSQRWIREVIGRYNEAGVKGLGDLRRFNPGSRRMRGIRLPPQGTPDHCSTTLVVSACASISKTRHPIAACGRRARSPSGSPACWGAWCRCAAR